MSPGQLIWGVGRDSQWWICQADRWREKGSNLPLEKSQIPVTVVSCYMETHFWAGHQERKTADVSAAVQVLHAAGLSCVLSWESPEAQGHAQPFTCSSSLVKCLSVGNKTLPSVHLRTHLPLFHMASLCLTIALGAHEAADTTEMTSVAVPLTRHSWPATKPCFIPPGSLAVLFLSLQTLLAPSARSRDFANSSCKVSGDRAPLCCFSRLLVLSHSLKLSQNCSDFSLTSRNWSSGALTLRLVQPRPGDYFGMSAFPAHAGWKPHLSNTS